MPRTEASVTIAVPAEDAFALSMSQLEVRYAWDPFVREQRLLHGATVPARRVASTRTFSIEHTTNSASAQAEVLPSRGSGCG